MAVGVALYVIIGAHFGVDEDTVLRWWHQGLPTGRDIPPDYHRRRGYACHLFHPQLIHFLQRDIDSQD